MHMSCKVDGFFSEVNSKATKNEDKLDWCKKILPLLVFFVAETANLNTII